MSNHTAVKAKCLDCNLHFLLCTWTPEKHSPASLYCPECGQHDGKFAVWSEAVPHPVFAVVPGRAALQGIGFPTPATTDDE